MTQNSNINISLYAETNIGMVRHGNEDNFLVADLSTSDTWTVENADTPSKKLLSCNQGHYGAVIAVSDGMGGALAGEVASQLAVTIVRDRMLQFQATPSYSNFPFHERLRLSVEQANHVIHSESQNNVEYTGMGATFTGAGIEGSTVYFAQVGDSRCYLIRNGKIAQATKDQSLVSQLVEAGHITEEEAESHTYKNVILQALGAQPRVNVIVDRLRLKRNDILLLCSDGLSGKVKGTEMFSLMQELNWDIKASCSGLIKLANERGGEDNITVVIAKFDGEGLEACSPDDPQKGEFVSRDSSLPDEVDAAQLTFGDEQTLRPDEDIISKVKDRERAGEVVETQEVQATMLNMQAITPQMLAQMSVENSAEPVATAAPAVAVSSAAENSSLTTNSSSNSHGSFSSSSSSSSSSSMSHSGTTNEPEEQYQGNNSRMITLVIVIVAIAILAVALVLFLRNN